MLLFANLLYNFYTQAQGNCTAADFAAVKSITSIGTSSFATGDFNGDGKQNVAVTRNNDAGDGFAILPGKGDGTFAPAVLFAGGGDYLQNIATGDFNSDGQQDIGVINHNHGSPDTINVLFGLGNGSFAESNSYMAKDGRPMKLTNDDFNKDGKPDLVFTALTEKNFPFTGIAGILSNTCGSTTPFLLHKSIQTLIPATVKQTKLIALPNPFSSQTTIRFSVEKSSYAIVSVFNVAGVEVKRLYQGQAEEGKENRTTFVGNALPDGVYILRLITAGQVTTHKVVLLR